MIAEAIVITLGACFVSSLAFAKWAAERSWEPGRSRIEWVRTDSSGDAKCQKCGLWCLKSWGAIGPYCQCDQADRGHFHIKCPGCKWTGFAKTLDGK